MRKNLLLATAALALVGCSTMIGSEPVKPGRPLNGVVYHLPATQLTTTITYELAGCDPEDLVYVAGVAITSAPVADKRPSSTFVVDPAEMSSWTKTIDVAKLELKDGRLKKVTYDVADKSGEIAASLAKTVAALGVPGAPIGLAAGRLAERFQLESGESAVALPCNDVTRLAAEERKAYIETADRLIKARRELAAKLATGADGVAEKIEDLDSALAATRTKIAQITDDVFQVDYVNSWTPDDSLATFTITPDAGAVLRWFDQSKVSSRDEIKAILAPSSVTIQLVRHSTPAEYGKAGDDGIRYRIAAPVKATITSDLLGDLYSGDISMLQFGPVAALSLKNGPFQDNKIEIEFADDGSLMTFDYVESASRLNALAGAGEAIRKEFDGAEKANLDREKELLDARKALFDGQKELIEAQKELEEAKKKKD